MVAAWLKYIHIGLHNPNVASVEILGADRTILNYKNNVRSLAFKTKDATWIFLTQNPNTNSEWAQRAKQGQKVTQVKREGKYYGVIVGENVFRYIKKGETPIWMGTLTPISA